MNEIARHEKLFKNQSVIRQQIERWLSNNGMPDVRYRLYFEKPYKLYGQKMAFFAGLISLYTPGWKNKLTVDTLYEVRSHMATTDSRFMHPLEEKFVAFLKEILK